MKLSFIELLILVIVGGIAVGVLLGNLILLRLA